MSVEEPSRLALPTLAVCLLLLVLAGVAAWYLHRSQRESAVVLNRNITRVKAAEELLLSTEKLQKSLDQYLLTGDHTFLAPMSELKQEAEAWIAQADALALDAEDRAVFEQIRLGHDHFSAQLEQVVRTPPAQQKLRETVSQLNSVLDSEVFQPVREYQLFYRSRLAESSSRKQMLMDRIGYVLLAFATSGAVAGLLAGFAAARGVQHRLLESERSMERSEQLATLGRVAAALAHELRNPLTSMRIITQSATPDAEHVVLDIKDFSILEQEIERLDSSVQTFLDYARPPRPEKQSCQLQSLVRDTVALIKRRAAQIDVLIHDELPTQSIEIEADPGQIRQVLLNILINALDASPNGGEITLRARIPAHGGRSVTDSKPLRQHSSMVEIEITDCGVGLPASLGKRVFDAFVSTKETGTGLGLAICRRIIEDHGGKIDASSPPTGGTIVTIRLPIAHQQIKQDNPVAIEINGE